MPCEEELSELEEDDEELEDEVPWDEELSELEEELWEDQLSELEDDEELVP